MTEWTRSTPWRQGSILDREILGALAESCPAMSTQANIAVVVSHDCDIAANPSIEPALEVIPGAFPVKEDGSFTHAKAARKLHLAITNSSTDQHCFAELRATDKFQIRKEQLADYVPCRKLVVSAKDLEILRRWLSARYRRHAFSDAFEERFDKVEDKFREILKKSNDHLRAILFDLDEDSSELDDPYTLDIYLVYTSEPDSSESLKAAHTAKSKIERVFQDKYKHASQWKEIELRSCEAISDEALTYAQYLQLVEWRSEGLSLRSDPFGPMA